MQRVVFISIDLALVAFATVLALVLRDNFDINEPRIIAFVPYVLLSSSVALIVFFLGGLDRTLWRYSSVADYLQIMVLASLVTLIAVIFAFAVNRLDGVPRSLPVLQFVLIIVSLVSVRAAVRISRYKEVRGTSSTDSHYDETILVVGANELSELFLRSAQTFASQHIRVAGILADEPGIRGRMIERKPILGTVEELHEVVASLHVHGVAIDKIVVAIAPEGLSPSCLATLLKVEQSSDIAVRFLSEMLGFNRSFQAASQSARASAQTQTAALAFAQEAGSGSPSSPWFWLLKRTFDACAAAFLMVLIAPIAALGALIVAWDVGFPLVFWQQRPGKYGRPFKLYKFRTMAASHDRHGKRIPDIERLSTAGQFLRRTRLDELPQLYNVLIGDMSFVGPRPLLPIDQSPVYAARLSVRPGITGWAQISGGRIISAADKAVLDIWYINKASFALDLKILLRTVRMVLLGDRVDSGAVIQARKDLKQLPTLEPVFWAEMATPAE